ncbi:MAG: ABC transporter permease [Verrucomicrobiales bacterium]|nr:ABC transporter permease [Verrucomicrobiales bacterium]
MNFLPVMDRELRVVARRAGTYHARSFAALVVILISLGMLYVGFGGLLSALAAGNNLFVALSLLAYVYVLLDGPFMTADCLSQEKRDGTMGLLFLTDLKGYDVVGGKLVSRSANSAYCLLAALPALGVGLFLGGVSGGDFFRMTLALMNGLFFSVAFGMLTSALFRSERWALSSALFGVLFCGALVPLLGLWLQHVFRTASPHPAFLLASPAGAFLSALGPRFGGVQSFSFASSLFLTHFMGWIFLALASVILPRAWQDRPAKDVLSQSLRRALRRSLQSQSRSEGGIPVETLPVSTRDPKSISSMAGRGRSIDENPIFWLDARSGRRGLGIWPIFVLLGMVGLAGCLFDPKTWLDLPVYAGSALVLHLVLMYAVAAQACRGPAEDRRSGVLELMLTTPAGEGLFLRGRMLSLKRQCFRPVMFVLAADLMFIIAGCSKIAAFDWALLGWVAFFLVLMAKLLVDLYTLSWVGFWQGLKAKTIGGANRQTIYYGGVLRWLILLGSVALLGLATQGAIFQSAATGILVVVGFIVLEVMSVLNFCGAAISELQEDLRLLVMRHDESGGEKFSWWPFHVERQPRIPPKLQAILKQTSFGPSRPR